ncbi:hypothetical protein MIMGU_mgv1a023368mg [Erythranthe guttata]|uniref:rRNA-processing protein FYV7 n=1 Tax=Erythranthe guttata TaxID=4155 RepID=A0A022S305_ERYGU|nr:hypothetical protein MIMGU_mgv1a023368mg [Erythranthe guttata]
MKKGGGDSGRNGIKGNKMGGQDFISNKKKMKKNMQRLGGKGGLSLESFVNAKTRNDNYNPSLIIVRLQSRVNGWSNLIIRGWVKLSSFKLLGKERIYLGFGDLKNCVLNRLSDVYRTNEGDDVNQQQEQLNLPSTDKTPVEGGNKTKEGDNVNQNKRSKKNARSLEELYKKKHEEEEKAKMEKERFIQTKKEAKQQSEARRRALKEKMYKKTKSGQPVMKYRIEHLLESLQGPTS